MKQLLGHISEGTGRYSFLVDCLDDGHLYARLERRLGSDAYIERVSFCRLHDSLYVDLVTDDFPALTEFRYHVRVPCIGLSSLDVLLAVSEDPDYPFEDLFEIKNFCEKYSFELSVIRAFGYENEVERRFGNGMRLLKKE